MIARLKPKIPNWSRRVVQVKTREALQRVREEERQTTEQLLAVLTDLVETVVEDCEQDDATAGEHLREILVKQGGHAKLLQKCQAVTATAGDHYQPFLWQFYTSHRKAIFHLVRSLPIHAATQDQSLMDALEYVLAQVQIYSYIGKHQGLGALASGKPLLIKGCAKENDDTFSS